MKKIKHKLNGLALLYHEVYPKDKIFLSGRQYYNWIYSIAPEKFTEHLKLLKKFKREIIKVSELNNYKDKTDKFALLTFDDGGLSGYEYAFKIMEENKVKGNFFIVTDYIDKDKYLTKSMLLEIAKAGHYIGSHSKSHRNLIYLNDRELTEELFSSKKIIEDIIQLPCDSFSIPAGFVTKALIEKIQQAGYKNVFNSNPNFINSFNDDFNVYGRWHLEYKPEMINYLLKENPLFILRQKLRWKLLRVVHKLIGKRFQGTYQKLGLILSQKKRNFK